MKVSKKARLLKWLQSRAFTRTSDILRWGSTNFHNRALRDAQELAENGIIRRLTPEEKAKSVYKESKEGIFTNC